MGILCLVVAAAGATAARAEWTADAERCRIESGENGLDACTAALASGRLSRGDRAATLNNRGVNLKGLGRYKEAIADLTEAIRLDSDYALAYRNRGKAYLDQKMPRRALADLNQAVRFDPKSADNVLQRGLAQEAVGDDDKALADYEAAARLDPKFAAAHNNIGWILTKRGEHDRAIVALDTAIKLDPDDALAYRNRSEAYVGKKLFPRALADADRAVQLEPKSEIAILHRGWIRDEAGDEDAAFAEYETAARLNPNYALAHNNIGVQHVERGSVEQGIASLNRAIEIDGNYALAVGNRCWAYNELHEYGNAIVDCTRAISLRPHEDDYNRRGLAYANLDRFEEALEDFDRAIGLASDDKWPRVNKGEVLSILGRFDEAITAFDETLKVHPDEGWAHAGRGFARGEKGEVEQATADLAAAVRLRPALARDILNDITEATAYQFARYQLRLALALDPELTEARLTLEELEERMGHAATAQERRVALVIANSAYAAAPSLPNPPNDARAIAAVLERVGFTDVLVRIDLGKAAMERELRAFSALAREADVALLFYAGHGLGIGTGAGELEASNWIVPIDARLEVDSDVEYEAVPLRLALGSVSGARRLRLVLLDACRNNPFAAQMRRTVGTRALSRGLAPVEPVGGTLVAFAARDGTVALDGQGRHSPFTAALLEAIPVPGQELDKLFRVVRDRVLAATDNAQEPFVYGSRGSEDFFFQADQAGEAPSP